MTGNVHHEAKAFDIIELTGLPTPGDLYEHGCQLHSEAIESIFQKPEPNISQMLSMMKPLPKMLLIQQSSSLKTLSICQEPSITSSGELSGPLKGTLQMPSLKVQ